VRKAQALRYRKGATIRWRHAEGLDEDNVYGTPSTFPLVNPR
jgi:hypothetical protein